MCCLSGRSGAVQIVKQTGSGIVYLRDGKIVHAEGATTRGPEALREIAGWDEVEFAYDSSIEAPSETISAPWDEALADTVVRQEEKPAADAPPPFKEPAPRAAAPQKKRGFFGALRRS
jgi:Domain of unknown function (DUF4388)